MQVFDLLLCIGLIGNSLGLPRPQLLPSIGSESENDIKIIIPEGEAVTNVLQMMPDANCSLGSNDILGDTNFAGKDSGTNQQHQLNSDNIKQETDISKNELIDKVGNITGQLGTLMKDNGQVIVSRLEEAAGNITKTLETLAMDAVKEQISENIQETKDKVTKTISSGIKSVVGSQTGKQIRKQVKAMSDRVSTTLGQLSSAVQHKLMNTIDPELMLQILSKIAEIEITVGHMTNDVEKIVEKTHIRENIEDKVTNAIKQVEAFVGEDSIRQIETIAHAVGDGVGEAVGVVENIINDVIEDENLQPAKD